MTAPANLIAPILARSMPELVFAQVYSQFTGGGVAGGSVSMALGAPRQGRKVVVVISCSDGVAISITGTPTLDGMPMTELMRVGSVYQPVGIFIADKPAGTTGLIEWTLSGSNADGRHVATYALYDAGSLLPDFSQSALVGGASINVTQPGAALGISWSWGDSSGTFTAPLTADFSRAAAQGELSGGHAQLVAPATVAPGVVNGSANEGLFVAVWK